MINNQLFFINSREQEHNVCCIFTLWEPKKEKKTRTHSTIVKWHCQSAVYVFLQCDIAYFLYSLTHFNLQLHEMWSKLITDHLQMHSQLSVGLFWHEPLKKPHLFFRKVLFLENHNYKTFIYLFRLFGHIIDFIV